MPVFGQPPTLSTMFNKWLKPYLPRSLFGRAFLILMVPIVVIQIVVGVVFVERLFQDVTRQMSKATFTDVRFIISKIENGMDIQSDASALGITVRQLESLPPDLVDRPRDFFDLSGRYVIETFHQQFANPVTVDLARHRRSVFLTTVVGDLPYEFSFARQRVSAANPHQLLVAMVLAAMVLTILAAVFLRNQVQPIRRLARAAEAFGKGQNINLVPRGASEVRSATHAFLSMRSRIERQIEQRTMMLSGVSHDLRTPLTRLKLSVSLLDQDVETEMMSRDLDEMGEILDEFLAFARGDGGEEPQDVAPKTFIKQLVKTHKRGGGTVDLAFAGNSGDDAPISIRRLAMQRAVSNLISNALKYGHKCRVTMYLGTGFIEFMVEDDGPGIRKEDRSDAVQAFNRLDAARNQDFGSGVGLGLTIAADVARSHGGTMTLGHSDDLGGLKASIRIPR